MPEPLPNAHLAAVTAGREAVRAKLAGGTLPAAFARSMADELADAAMAPLRAELERMRVELGDVEDRRAWAFRKLTELRAKQPVPRPCPCWPAYEHSEHCPIYVASVGAELED